MKLNMLRDKAFLIAKEHGWHDKALSDEHWLMLVVSELAEAVEADRKGKHADINQYKSLVDYADREKMLSGDILEQYLKEAFQNEIKDSVEDELSDVVIRCLDLAGLRQIELSESLLPTQAMQERTKEMTFTEWTYKITEIIVDDFLATESKITLTILNVIAKSEVMEFDLWWHVKEKMRYNETRSFKHGKNY